MDIDLEKEKTKLALAHSFEVRRLVLDKVLFGIIAIILGVLGNFALEKYRERGALENFLLEKRLEAVNDLQKHYTAMALEFELATRYGPGKTPNFASFSLAIQHFAESANKSRVLFSEEFTRNLDYLVWIHQGVAHLGMPKARKYRPFIAYLNDYLDSSCRVELGFLQARDNPHRVFAFQALSYEEADRLGAGKILDYNYARWLHTKRKEK